MRNKLFRSHAHASLLVGRSMGRALAMVAAALVLSSCVAIETPYRAYQGEELPLSELALMRGDYYYRKEWLNSYVDAVRFQRVDQLVIENSRAWDEVLVSPGERELEVYYYWDVGARMGLAPAIANYARTRDTISRTLTFNAEPGKVYLVKAAPKFSGSPGDITSLDYVDFWIEDNEGRIVLSRAEGRFQSEP
jgi:hypothetical protein